MSKKPWWLWLGLLLLVVGLAALIKPPPESPVAPSPTATISPTPPPTLTAPHPTPTLTLAPTLTPSFTASPIPPTLTLTPTNTPRPTNTARPTHTPTITPTATATPLPETILSAGLPMVLVPADYFIMGVEPDVLVEECALFGRDCGRALFEPVAPQHPLWLDAFYIDQYEVSNAAFVAFLNSNGATCLGEVCVVWAGSQFEQVGGGYGVIPGREQHPATNITWYGAVAYCAWRGGRLPTEAEWEKAASWDSLSNLKNLYPWGNLFDGSRLNFCDANCAQPQANSNYDDGFAQTAPIGTYPMGRSPAGADDMAGNVWEWVADWFSPRYYAYSPAANPAGPSTGQIKVVRGGSWLDTGNFTNALFRAALAPATAADSVGFRCAQSTP